MISPHRAAKTEGARSVIAKMDSKLKTTKSRNERETASQEAEDNRGRGWHGDPERHADAGRKGGETVSQNRDHMAEIGRRGGQTVSQDRQHMAQIGRRGGQRRRKPDEEITEAAQNQAA